MDSNHNAQTVKQKYVYWEWRTLILLMIGYALFYFVRKNFSIVMVCSLRFCSIFRKHNS